MISAPSAAWTVAGMPWRRAASASVAHSRDERRSSLECATEALAHAEPLAHSVDERLVHLASGLVGHAEGAVLQSRGDVLRRGAEARDLVVVDRGGAVH